MEYNDTCYEREIDLKDLMFAVMGRWRRVLAVSMAMAFLFGGFQGGLACLEGDDREAASDAEVKFEEEKRFYDQRLISYKREIDNLTEAIAAQQQYLDESVIMNMSPYDVWEAKAEFFLETDYRIMPGMVYQNRDFSAAVLQSYQSALNNAGFIEQTAEESGIEAHYLKELATVSIGTGDDGYSNLLVIRIRHGDENMAERLMDAFVKEVDRCKGEICSGVTEHTIREVGVSLGSVVDLELAGRQRDERSRLEQLMDTLSEKQESLEAFEREGKPKREDPFLVSLAKTVLRNGVMGGALGFFAAVFFICCSYVMTDKVTSAKELKYRFQIKILGGLDDGSHRNTHPFDAWLNKMEGRLVGRDNSRDYDLIAVTILNCERESGPVFVAGGAAEDRVRDVAENLGIRLPGAAVVYGGNFLSDPEGLKRLAECGSVVLVEQCGVSSYTNIGLEIEKIGDLHKQLTGCVVFE